MLTIHYGRENVNREKFIYDTINGKTIVLVPDQYTVQAERDAFFYTQKQALMDVEILSFSRLAERIFSQVGGDRIPMIDKQGRHMLLTKILRDLKSELTVYRNYSDNTAFIERANDFISETKQHGRNAEDLQAFAEALAKDNHSRYLQSKLADMGTIFDCYQRQIAGKYTDNEDRTRLMMERMAQAEIVCDNEFWIYGFDYYSPQNREIILKLAECAKEVHLLMTFDNTANDRHLFAMTGNMMAMLAEEAKAHGIAVNVTELPDTYPVERPETIATIEKNLFALPAETTDSTAHLKMVRAAGYYEEAETAAAEVCRLLRDEKMRYRDIAIICNDTSNRGLIAKRVFAQYGIDLFVDEKRTIMGQPAVEYVLALLDIIAGAYRREDVLALVKTGLTELTKSQAEAFENYTTQFGVKGPMFRKDFEKGKELLGEEEVSAQNDYRRQIIDPMLRFAEEYKEKKTVGSRIRALYNYLKEVARLPEKLEESIKADEEAGRIEQAAERAQIWNKVVHVMDQMVEVLGEEEISQKDFAAVFRAGCEAVEIGIIPPVVDGLMMGTMQRTRISRIKALLVMGANEGVLPAGGGAESIFSEEEKAVLSELAEHGVAGEICRSDRMRTEEENLALYRNFSKPTQELYVSCASADEAGKPLRSAAVFDVLTSVCPKVTVLADVVSSKDWSALTSSKEIAVSHLTEAVNEGFRTGRFEKNWQVAFRWFQENEAARIAFLEQGLEYSVQAPDITPEEAAALYMYAGELSVSPSRLEKFAKCPFAHFIRYGLSPQELRDFAVTPMELGDVYHLCMKEVADTLSQDGVAVTDDSSPWLTVSRDECDSIVDAVITREVKSYREGIFENGDAEKYRTEKLREICREACWLMVSHVRKGHIQSIRTETPFKRGKEIPPIAVDTPNGTVYIEGIIDRVDELASGKIKVVDYKSGKDKYSEPEACSGWKLQLFVYLRAACEEVKQVAGAYYFHIADPMVDAGALSEEDFKESVRAEIAKAYKMDGFTVNEDDVIRDIDDDFEGSSEVLPLRRKKDGSFHKERESKSGKKLLTREESEALVETVHQTMETLCKDLRAGKISVTPKKNGEVTACKYCDYRGICKFDPTLDGCKYEKI